MENLQLSSGKIISPSSRNAVNEWISSKSKNYEVIAQRRDADGSMIDRALNIVRLFIIERDLILFGGLAIDYALRIKGDHIYPDDQRPDFDFLSPKNVDDAYDLADILHKAGFEDVGTIRGIHVQTMKVRTNFVWVADIGYAPVDVFNKIPTINYQGMRIVHPDYQRMDIHLAFCFPFSGQPREDLFHRWSKDLKRFNLFEKYYPITSTEKIKLKTKKITGKLTLPIIGNGKDLKLALHGFAAYAIIRKSLDELCAIIDIPLSTIPRLSIDFPDKFTIVLESPIDNNLIVFASPWPESVFDIPFDTSTSASTSAIKKFSPYMDIYPETYQKNNTVILSTKGRKLAASLVSLSHESISHESISHKGISREQAFVVTPQYLLLWFLFESQRDDIHKDVYRSFYAYTLEIIKYAENIYVNMINSLPTEIGRQAAMTSFATSPFAPTISTIGDLNLDASYIVRMASNAERLNDIPPPILHLDPDVTNILIGLPFNYYPATSKKHPQFSYETSYLFRRSGQLWI